MAKPLQVGLIGGECTGKTTLAGQLAASVGAVVASEALRAFVAEAGRTPRRDEQSEIFGRQVMAHQQACLRAAAEGLLLSVCDPAPVMTAVYSHLYFGDDSLLAAGLAHANSTFDLVLWCAADLPWRADGDQRDGPAWRAAADQFIADLLVPALTVPATRVLGSREERLAQATAAIRSAYGVLHPDVD